MNNIKLKNLQNFYPSPPVQSLNNNNNNSDNNKVYLNRNLVSALKSIQ